MRGSLTFSSLFSDEQIVVLAKQNKGRNATLDARRTELLLLRYWYYGQHTKQRYDAVLLALEREFFITQRRISDLISQNLPDLKKLRHHPPQLADLRKKYPHINWN